LKISTPYKTDRVKHRSLLFTFILNKGMSLKQERYLNLAFGMESGSKIEDYYIELRIKKKLLRTIILQDLRQVYKIVKEWYSL
jgi:hypothetical protein